MFSVLSQEKPPLSMHNEHLLTWSVLFAFVCILPIYLQGQKDIDYKRVGVLIDEYRTLERGPYASINWFCEDGTMRDSKDPCPNGDGIQRARYRTDVVNWQKRYHFFPAQILAGTNQSEFWDAAQQQSRVKQYQLDQFLRRNDNGWIVERAQYYRGALQIEDEQEWGRDFLTWVLNKDEEVADHYFLLRQAVQHIPHAEDNDLTLQMRAISKVISDEYQRFMKLRVKIHNKPEKVDLANVKTFQETYADEITGQRKERMDELVSVMTDYYSTDQYMAIRERAADLPEDHKVYKAINAYLRYFNKDTEDIALLSATSDLLRDLRENILSLEKGSQRLAVMDISLMLEQVLFRNASRRPEITALEQMEELCYLEQAAYATGFLGDWEYANYSSNQWDTPAEGEMSVGRLLHSTEQSRRLLEWATNTVRVVYGREIEMYAPLTPLANKFVDDLVRSSVLLPMGEGIERLSAFAADKANLKNDITGVNNPSTMRGLNPGFAKGELIVMERAEEDMVIDPNKIYVFDFPPADLKPVAGIATVSEGNMVSHVQLLARNLGIPNAVLSSENLADLKNMNGQEVFYAVSPRGTIIFRPASEMTANEQALFAKKERSTERITVPLDKMELEERRVVNMRELDAASSGRWCGPKAANLGQLKKIFPAHVVEGMVVPFGIFRAHMDQDMPGKGQSYWAFLQAGFTQADVLRKQGRTEAQVEEYLIDHLAELREAISTIAFLPGFQQEFQDSFANILGKPLGELPVFLRSDTNMEDLKDFTGAGLNKTIFNVRDPKKIWDGIRKVWMSPYTERSFKWRQRYLNNPENVYPSLLVIPGVNVDYSGVVITQNVATGDPDDVTAAFSRGVGGAVDGQRAETYSILQNWNYAMLSPAREVNYLYLPESGGTNRGVEKLQQPLLNHSNLQTIKWLSDYVETNYPREEADDAITYDMEMGFKDNHLWLFQVRPFVENRQAAASTYLQSINPVFDATDMVDLTEKL